MKSSAIRDAFLTYFHEKGHSIVESSPLVPGNDPSLLFTNAGMVQFKDSFLGSEQRAYTRAVSSQRCLRAGGKHNDLDNVGYTARHHTFFEMLGNFSFGDYFKEEAISLAWGFLTEVLKLPKERLWVTVYRDDDEAAAIWQNQIGVPADRIARCGEADNFWSMGDTGPCGPCTEIFYDHGPEVAGGPPGSAEADGDRYIEIWNLVFMQFNRDKEGQLHPLPKPSVDTGMGLERIAAVMQGVHNNYDTDTFQGLIQAILKMQAALDPQNPSLKVIADHIRACAFLIADGVSPSNEGRGYVLRRIIRRAIRHGNKLKLQSPFFHQLVAPLASLMGEAYPELAKEQARIEKILLQEENQFLKTLDQGLQILQNELKTLASQEIPGQLAFKLYDTYGFPADLTGDIARELGLSIDWKGFELCMQEQRQLSQSASQFQIDYSNQAELDEQSHFHGYEQDSLESTVLALIQGKDKLEKLKAPCQAGIVLAQTPFYAESGGQVGDQGVLLAPGIEFKVQDTKRQGQAIIHYGELLQGEISVGDQLNARINQVRRAAIRLNHTATHLVHAALKQILGPEVQQKGSLVDAERARFDFSYSEAMTAEQIKSVEQLVNQEIRSNHLVETAEMELQAARQAGAQALFGEKYADKVRVLSLGEFSKELCGGTHAKRTGDIGLFKITAEYGVASGVRRIEILTGEYALDQVQQQLANLGQIADSLKASPSQILEKYAQQQLAFKALEKEVSQLKQQASAKVGQSLLAEVKTQGEIQLLVKAIEGISAGELRNTLDQLKSSLNQAVIVLVGLEKEKMNVVAGISKALIGKVPTAPVLVQKLCGRGGGREDMAQGGGEIPTDLEQRLQEITSMVMDYPQ